jgi:hypothetical protein
MEKDPTAMAILGRTSSRAGLHGRCRRCEWHSWRRRALPNIVASPANVAFAKANLAQLKPKMDAADGIAGR